MLPCNVNSVQFARQFLLLQFNNNSTVQISLLLSRVVLMTSKQKDQVEVSSELVAS